MKKLLTICLLIATSFTVNAQEKAILNMDQTIEYLQKRLNECEGHFRYPPGNVFADGVSKKMYYKKLSISYYYEKIYIIIESSNYPEFSKNEDYFVRYTTQSFNPNQIVSITESTTNKSDPLGIILIKFAGKSCVATNHVEWWSNGRFGFHGSKTTISTDESGFVYLQQDASNFNKIKKAFEHLKKLCNAVDDPFAE